MSGISFLISAAIALAIGMLFRVLSKPNSRLIYAREGFAIVAYAWLLMSAIGALPFVIGGAIPSYVDAFFETVSGFTTTGASILTDVEALDKCMLFWRSFTHWIGGMGILVLVTAVVPNIADRSLNILKAEMPGPTVGKLVPRSRDTAKILYYIYFGMTVILTLLLIAGGMPVFDSIVHAFGTAGTGGFGIKADSIVEGEGYIDILGGTVNITAGDDGIQAVTYINIAEGALVTVNAADKDVNCDGATSIAPGTLISK
jgi:trk system potassium uptake protein TrkH